MNQFRQSREYSATVGNSILITIAEKAADALMGEIARRHLGRVGMPGRCPVASSASYYDEMRRFFRSLPIEGKRLFRHILRDKFRAQRCAFPRWQDYVMSVSDREGGDVPSRDPNAPEWSTFVYRSVMGEEAA